MVGSRENAGRETLRRLANWGGRGQAQAERLAAQLLRAEGFVGVDPSHPLGGPDGLKDLLCTKDDRQWIASAYFPNRPVKFADVKGKVTKDLAGVERNGVEGFAFVTNQELTLGQRQKLEALHRGPLVLLHLERIGQMLDSPELYGVRLEFLEIEMTREEQVAFFASHTRLLVDVRAKLDEFYDRIAAPERPNTGTLAHAIVALSSSNAAAIEPARANSFSVDSGMFNAFAFASRLRKCTYCGYGFLVENDYGYRALTISGLHNDRAVACPKCGNVQPL